MSDGPSTNDPVDPNYAIQIRDCENCHGPVSLHNIQADSPNTIIWVTSSWAARTPDSATWVETPVPEDSDCWGCHGFLPPTVSMEIAAGGPGTGAIVPTVYFCEPAALTAGDETTIVVAGSAFTNTSGATLYSSNVSLTASDGSVRFLTPDTVGENTLEVTVTDDIAPGNYTLRVEKTGRPGKTAASNPVSITIQPPVYIAEASCPETTVTITGGGFGGHAANSVTLVTGK